jgi:excisionase family DNA binding protein
MKAVLNGNPNLLLLSADEACEELGISKSLLFQMTYQKEIPSLKIGRRRLWPRTGLEEWITKLTAKESKS